MRAGLVEDGAGPRDVKFLMVDGHQRPVVETSGSAETVGQLDEAECQALAAELGDNRGDLVEGVDVAVDVLPGHPDPVVGAAAQGRVGVHVRVDVLGAFGQCFRRGVEPRCQRSDYGVGSAVSSALVKA